MSATRVSDAPPGAEHAAPADAAGARPGRRLDRALRGTESAALLLVTALAAGVAGYGGYGALGLPMAWLLGLTAAVAIWPLLRRLRRLRPAVAVTSAALGALGGWAVGRAALAGEVTAGLPALGLAGALVLVLWLLHLAGPATRAWVVRALLLIGALAALAGWVGVVWRVWPLVLADQGMWRAAGPLGYPNALAGLLVPLTVVALARLADGAGRTRWLAGADTVVAFLLVAGGLASLSRGGAVAAAAATVVLLLLGRPGRLWLRCWPVLLGGLVAALGLLPSIREGDPAEPVTAAAALLAGLAVAVLGTARSFRPTGAVAAAAAAGSVDSAGSASTSDQAPRSGGAAGAPSRGLAAAGPAAVAVAVGVVTVAAVLLLTPLRAGLATVVDRRGTLASSWRAEQHVAAWQELREHPLLGTGPGAAELRWTTDDGRTFVARYVHDEYVQLTTEFGALGGVLLLAVLLGVASILVLARPRVRAERTVWAGAVAATVAFAVHSGFDFLWHIPALPLVVLTLVAAHSRAARPG